METWVLSLCLTSPVTSCPACGPQKGLRTGQSPAVRPRALVSALLPITVKLPGFVSGGVCGPTHRNSHARGDSCVSHTCTFVSVWDFVHWKGGRFGSPVSCQGHRMTSQ